MRSQEEFRLQCALADLLGWAVMPGVYWTAIPNGELRTPATGARLKRAGVRAGAPDLIFVRGSNAYGLELKRLKGGVQSDAQKTTMAEWRAAGGVYACCHGFEEAVEFLVGHGLVRAEARGRIRTRSEAA